MAGFAPLRTKPKQNINDVLADMIPQLWKYKLQLDQVKKQAEIYLQNQLKEYEAYGVIQSKKEVDKFRRDTALGLINPDFFKGQVSPEIGVAKTIQSMWPQDLSAEAGITIPADAEAKLAQTFGALGGLGQSRQTLKNLPQDQIATIIQSGVPIKTLYDTLDQIAADKQKVAERGIKQGELGATLEGLKIKREELEVTKGGGKTVKELKADLKDKEEKRQGMADMYYGIKGNLDVEFDEKKKGVFIADLTKISREVKELKNKLGIKPDADLVERVKRIKAQKYNIKSLFDDEELIRALTDRGINPLSLIEYW